jgi:hypothetical protein
MDLPKTIGEWRSLFDAYKNQNAKDDALSSLLGYLKKNGYDSSKDKNFSIFGLLHNDDLFETHYSNIHHEGRTLLPYRRAYVIWQALINVAKFEGSTMEVGVYRGGGSVFIIKGLRLMNDSKSTHYAIDTFCGHLAHDITSVDLHEAGHFDDVDFMETYNYLSKVKNIKVLNGSFAKVSEKIIDEKIKFVHLDTDLYKPTLDVLNFITPRLIVGGIVVVDDYNAAKCPGIKMAVQEFLVENLGIFTTWGFGTEQIVLVKVF